VISQETLRTLAGLPPEDLRPLRLVVINLDEIRQKIAQDTWRVQAQRTTRRHQRRNKRRRHQ